MNRKDFILNVVIANSKMIEPCENDWPEPLIKFAEGLADGMEEAGYLDKPITEASETMAGPETMMVNEDYKSYLNLLCLHLEIECPSYKNMPLGNQRWKSKCSIRISGDLHTSFAEAKTKKEADKMAAEIMVATIFPELGIENEIDL